MSNNLKTYISESAKKVTSNKYLFGNIQVFVKDPLPEDFDLSAVMSSVEKLIPSSFVRNVEVVYIGQFETLIRRDLDAAYHDGAIYLSNEQDNTEDMIDDIVHEIAHAVEEAEGLEMYSDNEIEREFLGKRQRLHDLLKAEGYDVDIRDFMNPEYSQEFDNFLDDTVGYPTLTSISMGLFFSPYAATSLREYFANGFEAVYYHRENTYLKKISPKLYNKIENLSYNA